MGTRFLPKNKRRVLALLSSSMLITAGHANLVSAAEGDEAIEEVMVTGSRIRRTEQGSTSPVIVLSGDEFRSIGSSNVEDMLNRLPQVAAGFNGTANNPSDGTATVDLRHLGSNRTLVLVNGRRYLQSTQQGTVDLNNVPAALIENVEIVTGGASAVYGSDAIAGVVNFKIKDDFEGLEFRAEYGLSHKGDAGKRSFSTTFGGNFSDDRGNIVAHLGFTTREKNHMADRDFSYHVLRDGLVQPDTQNSSFGYSTPCNGATNCVKGLDQWGGSSSIPATRINGVDGIGKFGPNGEPLPWIEASDRYNWSLDQYLQIPQERRLIYVSGHYDISDNVRFYAQAISSNNEVSTQLPPHSATPGNALVDVDSPFLSAATQAIFAGLDAAETGAGQNDGFAIIPGLNRRMVEIGNRQQKFVRSGAQFLAGFEGQINDTWNYNVYYSFAKVDTKRQVNNVFRNSAVLAGLKTNFASNGDLQCADASARALGCVPINIYGAGNLSQEAVDYLRVNIDTTTFIKEQVASAVIDGEIKNVGVAVGVEWREDSSDYRPGMFATGDITAFGGGKPTAGSFNVLEAFAEVSMSLHDTLDLSAGARISDYSTAGRVSSYAGGLVWSPSDSISVRGQYQRAVRAPNILELFEGNSSTSSIASDPCSRDHVDSFGGAAAMASLCEATGVAAGQTGQFNQLNTEIRGVTGGNPDLSAETSDTFTLGVVIEPEFVPNLSITIDYYSIKIKDAIDKFGGGVDTVLDRCYSSGDVSSPFCQVITRRPDGNVDEVFTTRANLANLKTSGVDVRIRHSFDLDKGLFGGEVAGVNLSLTGTYVINNQKQVDFEAPVIECSGTFGGTCGDPNSKWRSMSTVTYFEDDFSTSLTWRYMSSVSDRRIKNDGLDPAALGSPYSKAMSYLDLTVAYRLSETVSLNGGVNNILNAMPTFLGSNQIEANTFPTVYDVIGTQFFVATTVKF